MKGTSFIRWLTYRFLLETQHSRPIIGFDVFDKFPFKDSYSDEDKKFVQMFDKDYGQAMDVAILDLFLKEKGFNNYELVKGDVCKTIPEYVQKNPELRIALLHIDVDIYEPTFAVLTNLYDRVVRGGIIVFDDYPSIAGATDAIDDFFRDKAIKLQKFPYCRLPSFAVKA